jgi:hypothetical protein
MSLANKFIRRVEPSLSRLLGGVRTATSYLTPRDDWIEGLKRRLAVRLDPITRPLGRSLIAHKRERERFATVDACPDKVEVALFGRYQRNLASTRKYRMRDGERDWAVGSYVHDPDDTEWQHHVYLFDNGDGTTDVYGHKEQSAAKNPYGHVTGRQQAGDPDGLARGEIALAGLSYA